MCLLLRRLALITILFFSATMLYAQQEPQYTMVWNTLSTFNPAFSGLEQEMQANATYRHAIYQSSFFGDVALRAANISIDKKLENVNSGVGINYTYDATTPAMRTSQFMLNYNYQFRISDDAVLSTGVGAGLQHAAYSIQFIAPETQNDPAIPNPSASATRLMLNAGMALRMKKLLIGAGVTQLNSPDFGNVLYRARPHVFFTSAYDIDVHPNVLVTPGLYYKWFSDDWGNSAVVDWGTRITYKTIWTSGVFLRSADYPLNQTFSLNVMSGITVKQKVTVSYSHDFFGNSFISPWNEFSLSFAL